MRRALPHGHVAAVLGRYATRSRSFLAPAGNSCRDLVIAMIVARLIAPASKLATARMLDPLTAPSASARPPLERLRRRALCSPRLAGRASGGGREGATRKHLRAGMLVLYDVSPTIWRALLRAGAPRLQPRRQKGKLQIVYDLLCARDGCPVAIEVFEGDTAIRARSPRRSTKSRSASR